MNNLSFDHQILRDWVYQALQKPMNPNAAQLETLLVNVYNQACQEKLLVPRMLGPNIPASPDLTDIPPNLQNMIRGIVWDLIIQGILIPGIPNQLGSAGLPAFVISDWGKTCLQSGEYLTFDGFKYLSRLDAEIPNFDSIAKLYLKDSLASFRIGAYLSSAVMTGVASERLIILLRDAVKNSLPTATRQQKFEADTNGRVISRVFEAIWNRLESNQGTIASSSGREDLQVDLFGIFNFIRVTRNDAGHPKGRQLTRDEADSMLHLFPVYAKAVYASMSWLTANKLP